jgi:hypothetical protein
MMARKPIIGRVADRGIIDKALAQAYRKIDSTSKTTNIKMYA